jgi:hypothetical protein
MIDSEMKEGEGKKVNESGVESKGAELLSKSGAERLSPATILSPEGWNLPAPPLLSMAVTVPRSSSKIMPNPLIFPTLRCPNAVKLSLIPSEFMNDSTESIGGKKSAKEGKKSEHDLRLV